VIQSVFKGVACLHQTRTSDDKLHDHCMITACITSLAGQTAMLIKIPAMPQREHLCQTAQYEPPGIAVYDIDGQCSFCTLMLTTCSDCSMPTVLLQLWVLAASKGNSRLQPRRWACHSPTCCWPEHCWLSLDQPPNQVHTQVRSQAWTSTRLPAPLAMWTRMHGEDRACRCA
jgi:hypothetical protein